MLNVKNLTKVYSRGEQKVVAIDNISFTLGDSGLVFVTGKSGCGKSTLLNMIGGLDNITSGNVVCDGNDLSKFTVEDFDNYRNTYLGFVFQDYCLIEDLNVYQNIELGITIKGEKLTKKQREELVNDALRSVDLDINIKNRFIKELSGGQKQRVAIARALIKNPRLILADEPTGNLDSKTARKILDLLKKLSQDRLVVVVSHNLEDAKQYASRIIELADGKIVEDITRKECIDNKLVIKNGTITLPDNASLTATELKEINDKIKNNQVKRIKQNKMGFVKTKKVDYLESKVDISSSKMTFGSAGKLARCFIKKRIAASVVTVFVITLLVFVLGLCQFFVQYNEAESVYAAMSKNNEEGFVVYKGYYDEDDVFRRDKYIEIYEEEIEQFYSAGYTGKIYPILKDHLNFNQTYGMSGGWKTEYWELFRGIYATESFGTMLCDEEHLINKFGINGEIEWLAGGFVENSGGVVITDYLADCINMLTHKGKYDYDYYVGKMVSWTKKIDGIIKTDYKEKYADLFQYGQDVSMGIDRSADKEYYESMTNTLMAEVQKKYGLCYTINPNYIEDTKYSISNHVVLNYADLKADGFNHFIIGANVYGLTSLSDNEIALEYDVFNTIFGDKYGYYDENTYQDFEPIMLTLTKYNGGENCEVVYEKEVVVKRLLSADTMGWTTKDSRVLFVSPALLAELKDITMYTMAIYIGDASQLEIIYPLLSDGVMYVDSRIYSALTTVSDVVAIFNDFFTIILLGVCFVSVILLVSYAYGNIKKRYYEIGVLKSLGATTKDVGFVFSLQTILAGIAICALSAMLLLFGSTPINNIISAKLLEFVGNKQLGPITILKVDAITILINIAVIIFITVISCLLPLIKLNRIKPKKIIANKD
jgi:ABC-type lipoprotein export system ATPase subunit